MSSHSSLDQRLKDAQEMAVRLLSSTACVLTKEQIDLLEEKVLKSRLSLLPSFGLPKSPKEEVLEGGSLPSLELDCHSYFSSGPIFPEVVPAVEIVEPLEMVPEVEVLEAEEEKAKVPYRKDYNHYRWPSPRPKLFVNRLLGLKKSRLTHGYCLEYLSKRLRITEEELKELTPQEVSERIWGKPSIYSTSRVLNWWGGRRW